MENLRIARVLLKLAKYLEDNYEYRSDPDHNHRPKGGGWKQTEQGWSRNRESTHELNVEMSTSYYTSDILPESSGNIEASVRKIIKEYWKKLQLV